MIETLKKSDVVTQHRVMVVDMKWETRKMRKYTNKKNSKIK